MTGNSQHFVLCFVSLSFEVQYFYENSLPTCQISSSPCYLALSESGSIHPPSPDLRVILMTTSSLPPEPHILFLLRAYSLIHNRKSVYICQKG